MNRAPLPRLLDILKEDFNLPDESPFDNLPLDKASFVNIHGTQNLYFFDNEDNGKEYFADLHMAGDNIVFRRVAELDGNTLSTQDVDLIYKNEELINNLKKAIKAEQEYDDLMDEGFELPDESPFENVDVDFSDMNIEIVDMAYPSRSRAIANAVEYNNENSPSIELHCGFDDMSSKYMIKAWVISGIYNDRALTEKEIASLEKNREFIEYLEDMIYNDIESGDFPTLNEDFELPDESPFEFNKKKALEEIQKYLNQEALDFYISYIEEAIVDGDEDETLSDYLESAAERYPSEFELVQDHNIPEELTEGFSEEELENAVYEMEGEATSYAESEISEHPELYISNYEYIGSYNAKDEEELDEDFELPDESPFDIDVDKLKEELQEYTMQEIGYSFERMIDDCMDFPEEHGISARGSLLRDRCKNVAIKELKYRVEDEDTANDVYHAMLTDIEGSEIARLSDIEAKRRIEVMLIDQYKAFIQSI